MKPSRTSQFARIAGMLSIVLFLLSPLPLRAEDTSASNSGAETSFLEALVNAVRDFFAGFSNGGDPSDDSGDDSGNAQPLAAEDSDTTDSSFTPPPVAAAMAMASQSGDGGGSGSAGTINPDALARTIAADAGGHADQYDNYSERLAATLSKMTAEQRHRIFAAN